jgi:hypothetical protein
MLKIYNKETFLRERIENKHTQKIAIFQGSMKENAQAATPEIYQTSEAIVRMTGRYENSDLYNKVWSQIKDLREKVLNQNSVPENLASLIQLLFVDVTRRVMEIPDFTSQINIETTNFDYPESVSLREIYKYRGVMLPMLLENDSVPLIEQYSGAVGSVIMEAFGVGWKDTLKNLLYNKLFDMQKVLQAAAEAYVNERNNRALGYLFSTTFKAKQKVNAVNTGTSFDTNLYDTYREAYVLLKQLLDPQNGFLISIPSITLLIHSARRWESERVILGKLEASGANMGSGQLRSALPIDTILEYNGTSFTWGKKKITFAGCDINKAYLFVPNMYSYTLVKRPLTMEVGRGSVLQLSNEERAWYGVQTEWYSDLLGSSMPGSTLKTGYGAIVEIDLPAEPES